MFAETLQMGRSSDPAGWRIRLDAKPGTVGLWKRIEVVVSDDGWLPLQEKHYDRRDQLARVMSYDDVRALGGRRILQKPYGEQLPRIC
jgi:hypothetical protein